MSKLVKNKTAEQYAEAVAKCRKVFAEKNMDYGAAWRILHTPSLTDQLCIKASRIRSIEDIGTQNVGEGVEPEFMGIINYSMMALVLFELGPKDERAMNESDVTGLYDMNLDKAFRLRKDKNHDDRVAWRDFRISSFSDKILMKLLHIKQLDDNGGQTLLSEGVDANYFDIMN